MANKCPEEFNPWPPFVDIFASVILVMLLFLLITIVNIGYYAQFKYKVSYTASVETQAPIQPEDQTKVNTTKKIECKKEKEKKKKEKTSEINAVSFHKITNPSFKDANNSFFSGGEKEGNAVKYKKTKSKTYSQKAIMKNLTLTIHFKDKEIFLNSSIKRKIYSFVGNINRKSKNAIYTIYVSDPKNVISSTIAKQISLGRVLNVKNIIKRSNVKPSKIKMDLQHEIKSRNPNGDVTIKAHIP